ncbi:hypothetical protein [Halorubrum sp. Atlit-28R]|uniref:hypothetical protein n=1 Tax=Halorubrum sp. Atlit-28R TaxID=2282129 RepID=UPI0011C3D478|nr:hypothetical protein [Halorubrum sp. Atlit-28R]
MSNDTQGIKSRWPRIGCVRVTLPDGDQQDDRYLRPVSLRPVVNQIFGKHSNITRLEILSWPGDSQQEWIFFPRGANATELDENAITPDSAALSEINEALTETIADREEVSGILTTVKNACEEHLPGSFGYDFCSVDLAPLESTIRPTSRLIARESPDLKPFTWRSPHPITDLFSHLYDASLPHLFQVIIDRGKNSDYQVSQRLAVYPPNYGIATGHDLAKLLEEGPQVNLSRFYDPNTNKILSNFDLDSSKYFKFEVDEETGKRTATKRYKHGEQAAKDAQRILEGKRECYELYAGFHDTDAKLRNLYPSTDYYTKIAVNESDISAFIKLVPNYYAYTPWSLLNYQIQKPEIIGNIKTFAAGSRVPHRTDSEETTETSTFATQGSDLHQEHVEQTRKYYEREGYEVEILDDQSTDSVPDLRVRKDEITHVIEVEVAGTSRPANVLTNAGRAFNENLNLIFVAENKRKAQRLVKILRHPVKKNTPEGAQLYTYSEALTLADGGQPLLPAGTDETSSTWYLRHDREALADGAPETGYPPRDDELQLVVDGDVIASGPADESVTTWEYDTTVVTDGEIPAGRTRIHAGFVPSRLSYLRGVEIRYVNGKELSILEKDDYPTEWDYSDAEGKRKRYRAAYDKFITQKTVPVSGGEIDKRDVMSTIQTEFYKPQTGLKAPGPGESGKALRDSVNIKPKQENTLHVLTDRVWRWRRGIESPDTPFTAGESLGLDDWG